MHPKLQAHLEELAQVFNEMFEEKTQPNPLEPVFVLEQENGKEYTFYGEQARQLISFVQKAEENLFTEITATGYSRGEIISDFFAQLDEQTQPHKTSPERLYKMEKIVKLAEENTLFLHDGRLTVAVDKIYGDIGFAFQGKHDEYNELTGKYVALLRLLDIPLPEWV